MPFDGLPEAKLDDATRLKAALAGVMGNWTRGRLGRGGDNPDHCLVGWILVACDDDVVTATRLAVDYVYPCLPKGDRRAERIGSLMEYNDRCGQAAVARLLQAAVARAMG